MIRQATAEDAAFCAPLLYSAGKRILSYSFACQPPLIYDVLKILYHPRGNLFSSDSISLSVTDTGTVQGLIVLYPGSELTQREVMIGNSVKEIFRHIGLWCGLKMMLRNIIPLKFPEISDEDFYIGQIAVFDEFQGKGVGTDLLKYAEEQARSAGYKALSLMVEDYNKGARKLYESFGFVAQRHHCFPKKYHKHGIEGVAVLRKELR